jgi:hypothetical protein
MNGFDAGLNARGGLPLRISERLTGHSTLDRALLNQAGERAITILHDLINPVCGLRSRLQK